MPRPAALALLLGIAIASPCRAQAPPVEVPAGYGVRVHVGMWTSHLSRIGHGLEATWLVAVGWRGLYGGTFVNSFGDRAFAAGIQRRLARTNDGTMVTGLGYRLGFVTGYDERLTSLAGKTPVLPAAQLLGDFAMGRTGLEVAWAGKVATMGPFMRVAN
jgi:hypothetical protein